MIESLFEKYDVFLFALIRMTGFIAFNPIFGRRNIPAVTKAAIAFVLTLAVLPSLARPDGFELSNLFQFAVLLIKEFIVGYIIGLAVNIFFSVISISGEIMDMQMGLGMSKMYDPGSNIQMPLIGSFYNAALTIAFFLTGAHNTLIRIAVESFDLFDIASIGFGTDAALHIMRIFSYIFTLSIQLAFPLIAAELIAETGIGIIMRAVPQINVFVVGVQLKIIIALVVLIAVSPATVWFFGNMLDVMNSSVAALVQNLPILLTLNP